MKRKCFKIKVSDVKLAALPANLHCEYQMIACESVKENVLISAKVVRDCMSEDM